MNVREVLWGWLKGAAICVLFSYAFYRSMIVFWCMLPLSVLAVIRERKRLMNKRYQLLAAQFKESVTILASLLSAGYSVENALANSVEELAVLYGRSSLIVAEYAWMVQQMRMNRPVESLLKDLGERSGMEDIQSFAEVFSVAKRSSGDLGSIMRHTAEVIRDKMQMREEIITMTASRRYEQRVMNLIPFFLLFYIESASPGFFDQMYGTGLGRLLMSGCMVVYVAAYLIAEKILDIEM